MVGVEYFAAALLQSANNLLLCLEGNMDTRGNLFYTDANTETLFNPDEFVEILMLDEDSEQHALHTNIGSLTVLDRLTGYGFRDVESGFRDEENHFWLASGNYDVRRSGCKTLGEAIEWVKERANTCVAS